MGIQPAMVSTAKRAERSEFKHDRLLKGSSWGTMAGHESGLVVDDGHHPSGNNR
jgi:hypothetical protein